MTLEVLLALLLVWAALIVAVLVAIARYRDHLEGSVTEEVVARIQRNGFRHVHPKKEKQ